MILDEDSYAEEYGHGLFLYSSGVQIRDGMNRITFTYKDELGNVLDRETVPVMYDGIKGEDGAQGASYKGTGTDAVGTGIALPWADGDYYLNVSDGFIYCYKKDVDSWQRIPEYTDYRYQQAINDGFASVATNPDFQIIKALNVWANNLLAKTAFIDNLLSKHMTLMQGGVFKSSNYNGTVNDGKTFDDVPEGEAIALDNNGTEGFAQDSNGNTDIVNLHATGGNFDSINIGGDSVFTGNILSGPLQLTKEGVSGYTEEFVRGTGTYENLLKAGRPFGKDKEEYRLNSEISRWGAKPLAKYRQWRSTTLTWLNIDLTFTDGTTETIMVDKNNPLTSYLLLSNDYSDSYKMKLNNLPGFATEKGAVYVEDGYLRIVP